MGMDEIEHAKRDKRKAAQQAHKALPETSRKGGGVADWANADANLLLQLVCKVGVEGGAVRYGYTRDGGAYSIGLYVGPDSKTYYCNETDGINETLSDLIEYFG